MRAVVMTAVAAAVVSGCASAPKGAKAPSPLTSVDTVYYEVAGSTPAQWRRQLPRAAANAGIANGGVTYTLASMLVSPGHTRTTSIGCQFDGSSLLLRFGHVMPRLSADASPSAEDKAEWDTFVATLWERAHLSEEVGQRLADSIRVEMRHERAQECGPLIEQAHKKLDEFGPRYTAAMRAAEAARGAEFRAVLP